MRKTVSQRVTRVRDDAKCVLCHPAKQFKDLYDTGRHMVRFHKLTAETRMVGGHRFNTGWWVK